AAPFLWVVGSSDSATFPKLDFGRANAGSSDAVLAEFDPRDGTLLGSTFFGGSGPDYANGMAVDSTGAVYLAGSTLSANFPLTNETQGTVNTVAGEARAAKNEE